MTRQFSEGLEAPCRRGRRVLIRPAARVLGILTEVPVLSCDSPYSTHLLLLSGEGQHRHGAETDFI
jgi:hypothetical protein